MLSEQVRRGECKVRRVVKIVKVIQEKIRLSELLCRVKTKEGR